MAENGIRTPNVPNAPLLEVLGHYDAGGGQRALGRASLTALVDALRGIISTDPTGVASLRSTVSALSDTVDGKASTDIVAAVQTNLSNLDKGTTKNLSDLRTALVALIDAVQTNLSNLDKTVAAQGQAKFDAMSIQPLLAAIETNRAGTQTYLLGKIVDEALTRYTDDEAVKAVVAALAAAVMARLSAHDDLIARAALLGGDAGRPGDGAQAFTHGGATGPSAALPPLPPAMLAMGDNGMVARCAGADLIARRAVTAVERSRVYRARGVVQRRANPSDPSNDAVRLCAAWLDQACNQLPGADGSTILKGFASLVVADGRQEIIATFSRNAASGAALPVPKRARFMRLYVQTFGLDGQTDVEILQVDDITNAFVLDPVSSDLTARVDAIDSAGLPARLSAVETQVGNPLALTYQTRSDAAGATVPSSITLLRTLGRVTAGDGKAKDYRRVGSLAPGVDGFSTRDGAVWQAIGVVPAMQAVMLNIERADIAGQYTGPTRFRTLNGAAWKLGGQFGPYAIQNLSGDWFELDLSLGVVRPEWFGAVGDFVPGATTWTDNKDAMARMFGFVPNGAMIVLGACLYAASAYPTTYTKGYGIEGQGSDVSGLVVTGGGSGPNIQLAGKSTCALRKWSMLTTGVDQGTGITIAYNSDPSRPFANRETRRLDILDFHTRGVDTTAHGFNTHGRLTNLNGADYSQWWMNGRATGGTEGNAEGDNSHTPFGLILDGTVYPTDHIFHAPRAYAIDVPLYFKGACEGIILHAYTIVNCGWLAWILPDEGYGGRPQAYATYGHCNTYKGGLKLSKIQSAKIVGGMLYRNPGSTSRWIGIDADNLIDCEISANELVNQAVAGDGSPNTNSVGIRLSGAATANVRIHHNHIGGTYAQNRLGTGIEIAVGTPGVIIEPTNTYNAVTAIADGNLGAGLGLTQYGGRAASLYLTNSRQVGTNPTPIAFDTVAEDTIGLAPVGGLYSGIRIPSTAPPCYANITAGCVWNGGTGFRTLEIRRNGLALPMRAFTVVPAPGGVSLPQQVVARRVRLLPGDEITLQGSQDTGAPLGVQGSGNTWLSLELVG